MSNYAVQNAGHCPPGVACPTPMALPSYTKLAMPLVPMPIQQSVNLPQQQFGIVGGPSTYTPPPAVSYAPHYVCYNAGNQSYNNTIGTLANIIIGAIYSTPMSGGNMPGQLSTNAAMMPYASYMPPGQHPDQQYDLNQQYEKNCGCQPKGYKPQPTAAHPQGAPAVTHNGTVGTETLPAGKCSTPGVDSCGVKNEGSNTPNSYKKCDPCAPRAPKAYDALFDGSTPKKSEGTQKKDGKDKVKSEQWEANVSGKKGTIKISDRYEIKLDESKSEWVIYDKCEKKTTTIWGDPHLKTAANGTLIFKETMTFVLEDGTKITARTTPSTVKGETLTSELYITNGDKSMKVSGLAQSDFDVTDDGALSVVTSLTNGVAVDKMIDDGALTVYQVGDLWVNSETGKQLTQAQIDNAESSYEDDEDNENAYKGSDKKDDELKGTSEDDTYIATEGEDSFDGKGGKDTAVFEGDIEDYEIIERNGKIIVKQDDMETVLTNVEVLQFGEKKYVLSIDGMGNSANSGLGNGNEMREIVFGQGGDDTFTIVDDAKTKYYDGGSGTDTLKLAGSKDDYEFDEGEGDTVVITKDDKVIAVISNIEMVQFKTGDAVKISELV